jgi:tRNA 5-methylaminomethyl-2-thiouridine biosynthesis bifunctional protein
MAGVEAEALQFDPTGAPFSARYGDVYASRSGALGQARHVFLAGNDLPARWRGRDQFVILETGFGLGINFLATWQAWREDPSRPRRLHFVSIERHPLAAEDLAICAPPALRALATQLSRRWPPLLTGLHRRVFESGGVTLTLGFGHARALIPDLDLGADAFYLDGFAPERNPDLWEPRLLKALARLARPGATLATWTVARAVREALAAAGFDAGLRDGFGSKRQMLVARYAPRFRARRHEPSTPYSGPREAIVVGAGLGGCTAAAALAHRGWRVALIDEAPEVASGASALPSGLLYPTLTADDSHAARLARAGFLFGRAQLDELLDPSRDLGRDEPREGDLIDRPLMRTGGVLRVAGDEGEQEQWPALLREQRWPAGFVRWCSQSEGAHAVGLRPRRGGLWFESGAIVSAAAWCRALLASEPSIQVRNCSRAIAITYTENAWTVQGRDAPIARAPVVVVASAMGAPHLLQARFAPVRAIRGRVTRLSVGELSALRAGVSGLGYLLPGLDGRVSVGATYEAVGPDLGPGIGELTAHESNLERLRKLIEEPAPVQIDGGFDGIRCVATDRMPLAGAVGDECAALTAASTLQGAHLRDLPRRSGLYASFALGSRGLTLAPLLGELLACLIEGDPLPLERSLASTIDPARFLLRCLRKNPAL